MNFRRAVFIAALGLAAAASPALAQTQPGPGQQQAPPCIQKFIALRNTAQTKGKRLQALGSASTSPPRQVACRLLTRIFGRREQAGQIRRREPVLVRDSAAVRGNMKKAHQRTTQMRTRVCRVATEQRARPRGPTPQRGPRHHRTGRQ